MVLTWNDILNDLENVKDIIDIAILLEEYKYDGINPSEFKELIPYFERKEMYEICLYIINYES